MSTPTSSAARDSGHVAAESIQHLVRRQHEIVEELQAVADGNGPGSSRPRVRTLRSRPELHATLTELESTCQREQLSVHVHLPPPELHDLGSQLNTRSLRRGVWLRDVISATITDQWLATTRPQDAGWGERFQIRVASQGLLQVMVIDRATVLMSNGGTGAGYRVLMVEEPSLVQLVVDLTEHVWAHAVPLEDCTPPTATSLTVRQHRVLEHLCAGLDDDTIAALLGMSTRTLRVEIAAVLDHLGASSRCEAGFRAGQLGLLRDGRGP